MKRTRPMQTELFHDGQAVKPKDGVSLPRGLRKKIGNRKLVVFGTLDSPGCRDSDYYQTVSLAFSESPSNIIGSLPGAMLTKA